MQVSDVEPLCFCVSLNACGMCLSGCRTFIQRFYFCYYVSKTKSSVASSFSIPAKNDDDQNLFETYSTIV